MNKSSKEFKIQLPDCVIWNIFSKLGLKDLVKTSTLSKLWLHEWQFRKDLNFDLCNLFDYNKVQELPKNFPSEFATRLDQFMLHYQGDMIDSIRVKCPLSYEHSDVIKRLISKGIAKGAKRIELLLSYGNNDIRKEPCEFSFELLFGTDSLTYLHLQNFRLKTPMEFSGLKNLRTLVLQLVAVRQTWLEGLFSNCIHLVDFTIDECAFMSDLKIISSTLFRLNIVNCRVNVNRSNIDIIASNLSSMEYSSNDDYSVHRMNIEAHMLSKFSYKGCKIYKPVGFSGLKNVTTIVLDGLRELQRTNIVHLLFSECLQLEDVTFMNCNQIHDMNIVSSKLRHLKIIGSVYNQCIDINTLNLASFEYSGKTMRNISVTAPRLSRVFWNAAIRENIPHPFGPIITTLQHIENLAMIISTSQVSHSKTMFAS
ncbi:hypothetical protein TSUD_331820 [Trifolium subterraneum]|uniref:Uncharacterized protein n=1 Tax=Trifolium subterraneum TaxID=3900 RepID=A0A2Z6NZL9_TRISU|nr:hypothetical protein TSUD_331820 [Trifolium subterraneum]